MRLLPAWFAIALLPTLAAAQEVRLDFCYAISLDEPAFGRSLAVLDDVDGDSFPDFAVAASVQPGGVVHLLSGRDGSVIRTFVSPQSGDPDLFARAMSMVPDVNDDGIGDLAIGASDHVKPDTATASGVVYIVDPVDFSILHTLGSPQPVDGGKFGFSLDGFGGNQTSGLRGVLVGAPSESGPASENFVNVGAGHAYVFNGRTGELEHSFYNPTTGEDADATNGAFGAAVAAVSGFNYFYVGEPGADFSSSTFLDSGRVYLYQGLTDTPLIRNPAQVITDARFGEVLATAPNINRENAIGPGVAAGIPDSLPEDSSMNFGRAEVFNFEGFNAVNRNVQAPLQQTNSRFGQAVEGILDVGGDGRGDVLVGQPDIDDRSGFVHVYDPFTNAMIERLPRAKEPQTRGRFGAAIAGHREHHGFDARRRMLVGAPGTGIPGSPAPQVYVYRMGSRLRGDLNDSRFLDATDLSLMAQVVSGSITVTIPRILDVLDLNCDTVIDQADYDALDRLINGPVSTTSTTSTSTTTTSTSTTSASSSTTLAPDPVCGDASGDGTLTATDALIVLQSSVGSGVCPVSRCDTDGDGKVTATDALRVLRAAVGLPTTLSCPVV
jgi:hypothetical protein